MKKKILIIVIVVIVLLAAFVGVYFGMFYNPGSTEEETTDEEVETIEIEEEKEPVINPLTGEDGFNEKALGQRYVSVVVENSAAARPQYNMESADVICEVEVEGGITRMLWVFADMTSLPEKVGPVRSARPVLIDMAGWFGSIFIHYGGSHSESNYTGAYELISSRGVNDIDGMSVSSCFKRTSDKKSPHNAALLGDKLVSAINKKGYSTTGSENVFTPSFYEDLTAVSEKGAQNVSVTISSVTDTHKFTYNSEKGVYVNSSDYGKKIKFANLVVLETSTSYVSTSSYTYCLYNNLGAGGKGTLVSGGAAADITWSVENGALVLKDASGNDLQLNTGKTWVALVSNNHGGKISISEA